MYTVLKFIHHLYLNEPRFKDTFYHAPLKIMIMASDFLSFPHALHEQNYKYFFS